MVAGDEEADFEAAPCEDKEDIRLLCANSAVGDCEAAGRCDPGNLRNLGATKSFLPESVQCSLKLKVGTALSKSLAHAQDRRVCGAHFLFVLFSECKVPILVSTLERVRGSILQAMREKRGGRW